jgi:hypothetical protein
MKSYYVGDRIDLRTLCTFGFIKKVRNNKNSDLITNPDSRVKLVVSRSKNPKILSILGARCICYFQNSVR